MKKILIWISFTVLTSYVSGQIVQISEVKGYNDKIKLRESAIVDINSNLELHIIIDSLNLKISKSTKGNPVLLEEIDQFNLLLTKQTEIVSLLNEDLSQASDEIRIQKLGEFSNLMSGLYRQIFENKNIEEKINSYAMEFTRLDKSVKEKYSNYYIGYAFEKMSEEISKNLKSLAEEIDQKQIKIQMSAYLNTKHENRRKVHIENFDEYNLGEYYEVDRWVTSFSEEDVSAFNSNKILAANLNALVDKSFKDISTLLKNNIKSYSCFSQVIEKIDSIYNNRLDIFEDNRESATSFLLSMKSEYINLFELIKSIKSIDGSNENVLIQFNSLQSELIQQAKLFPKNIDTLIFNLSDDLKNSNQPLIELIDNVKTCLQYLREDLVIAENLKKITGTLLLPAKSSAEAGLNISKEVFDFSINDLPEFGFIDLKTTGKRANGDKLEVQLSIRSQEDIDQHKTGVIIEKQLLTLQQISVYSVSNVSVILASPYNYSTNKVMLDNTFQFAPAASLLFKFGSRTSRTYNFLNPGLGLNISTPDFDLDGTPEVGIGAVFTILQDVLSAGISYNTKTDNPFWFFGLSLPFSTLGLPINKIQTDKN